MLLQGPHEASLSVAGLPARVVVGVPFTASLRVRSHVDQPLGPLRLAPAPPEGPPPSLPSPASTPPRRRSMSGAEGTPGGSRGSSVHAAGGGSPAAAQQRGVGGAPGGGGAPSTPTAALAAVSTQAVCLDGAQEALVGELPPQQEAVVSLRLLALASGQQVLPALALFGERDGRHYASLAPAELFVHSC